MTYTDATGEEHDFDDFEVIGGALVINSDHPAAREAERNEWCIAAALDAVDYQPSIASGRFA